VNEEQTWWTDGFKEGYRAGLSDHRPPNDPSLGRASNRELLQELQARFEDSRSGREIIIPRLASTGGGQIVVNVLEVMQREIDRSVLDYRRVSP